MKRAWWAGVLLAQLSSSWAADTPLGHKDFCPSPNRPVGWRGDGSGHYPSANPPLTRSPRNLVWKVSLPNWSNASPIVVGDRVFVCSEPTSLICVAEADGRILWERDAEIVDDLLTPDERTRFESTQRRLEALERERISLLIAMSREAAKSLPGPDERERLGEKRRERIDALKAEQAEIARCLSAVPLPERFTPERLALAQRQTGIADALYREEAEYNPSAAQSALQPDLDRLDAAQQRERKSLKRELETWAGRLPTPPNQAGKMHPSTGYSTPTPVSDGRFVYAAFGTGAVACFNVDGGRRWIRYVGQPSATCGQVASPVLLGGRVIVHFAHPSETEPTKATSFTGGIRGRVPCLAALDAGTGEVLWRTPVGGGAGTAVALRAGEHDVLVTPAGDVVRAADGRRLLAGTARLHYNSPAVRGDVLYFVDPQHAGTSVAVRLSTADGMVRAETLWTTPYRKTRGFATPLCHDGILYAIGEDCALTAQDATTGEMLYEQSFRTEGWRGAYSSVTRAGDSLFIGFERGGLLAFRPGSAYRELGRFDVGALRSTPAFRGNRMYVRTLTHLYCIEGST